MRSALHESTCEKTCFRSMSGTSTARGKQKSPPVLDHCPGTPIDSLGRVVRWTWLSESPFQRPAR